jgi:catechol 2,3-dioxygenase-like lactoylglutathione lyase family enzyme
MAISLNHSFLFVRDQDEALAFYTELLGLELRSDADMGHMRWLTVGAPGQDVQLQEPIRQSYGVIDCAFRDPSGNMIRFSEYVEA